MITKLTGVLQRVLDDQARMQVGPIEYQVLVPEFVRRNIQDKVGQEISLHITEYLEGNPNQGRMVPRMIGFGAEIELEFFELFCTVDKVGVKKALKALGRPVKEIAEAIQRQDHRWLSTLPGVGGATAEKIVATLRKKVTHFSMLPESTGAAAGAASIGLPVLSETLDALITLGMNPIEARGRIDKYVASGEPVTTVEEILPKLFQKA